MMADAKGLDGTHAYAIRCVNVYYEQAGVVLPNELQVLFKRITQSASASLLNKRKNPAIVFACLGQRPARAPFKMSSAERLAVNRYFPIFFEVGAYLVEERKLDVMTFSHYVKALQILMGSNSSEPKWLPKVRAIKRERLARQKLANALRPLPVWKKLRNTRALTLISGVDIARLDEHEEQRNAALSALEEHEIAAARSEAVGIRSADNFLRSLPKLTRYNRKGELELSVKAKDMWQSTLDHEIIARLGSVIGTKAAANYRRELNKRKPRPGSAAAVLLAED